MRRPAAHRQRVKKALMALLLLPLAGLGTWLLFFASGDSEQRPESARDRALVESSSTLRGNIYDRNFNPLAISFRLSSLYARPLEITAPEETATALARILDLNRDELLDSFRSERGFVWLARQVEKGAVNQVLEGDFQGVYLMPRSYRYYPHGAETAHVVGFVKDEQGLAGIELAQDNMLRGGVADAWLTAAGFSDREGGGSKAHLVTTLDLRIQQTLEQRLQRAMRSVSGQAAAALLMDVNSGAILAMVSLPGYDSNRFWSYSAEERTNLAVVPQVHFGALWEIFRLAASLELNSGGVSEAAGEEFFKRIGLCGPTEFDLLEGRRVAELGLVNGSDPQSRRDEKCRDLLTEGAEAQVSGVALLAAVSRLVNGGRAVDPHLVRGYWDGEHLRELNPGGDGAAFSARSESDFMQALTTLASAGTGPAGMIFESLVAQGRQEAVVSAEEPELYQAVLLGLVPPRQPSLAILMFIDQARIDPAMPSPLAGVARELPNWNEAMHRSEAPPLVTTVTQREADLYQHWLAGQEAVDFAESKAGSPVTERMPSVLGLSMRKALQSLQVTGLRFQVHGSGWVVEQYPAPGTVLRGGEEGVIELRAGDLATADGGRR